MVKAEKINDATKKSIECKAFLDVTTNIELIIKKLHVMYKRIIIEQRQGSNLLKLALKNKLGCF